MSNLVIRGAGIVAGAGIIVAGILTKDFAGATNVGQVASDLISIVTGGLGGMIIAVGISKKENSGGIMDLTPLVNVLKRAWWTVPVSIITSLNVDANTILKPLGLGT
jgi:hypothetical protein